jgi:hypothetical protein
MDSDVISANRVSPYAPNFHSWNYRYIGFAAFIVYLILLFFTERNNRKKIQQYDRTIQQTNFSTAKEDKPYVFLTGDLEFSSKGASDPQFKVSTSKVLIERVVECYQYSETILKTQVVYEPHWSREFIDSTKFKDKSTINLKPELESCFIKATDIVTVGSIQVDPVELVRYVGMQEFTPFQSTYVYSKSCDKHDPKIGDYRVSYKVLKTEQVSIFGVLKENKV